jgi:hypothetical protein
VNGALFTPVWTSNTAWRITVPLAPGSNILNIRGLDKTGAPVAAAASSLTVENANQSPWPALRINEWMADNAASITDPADNKHDDWFELHNPTAQPVDLSGWKLSDDPLTPALFTIPAGWTIPANGYLLVWADSEPAQNPATPVANSALHAGFKLSKEGDNILLTAPDGREIDRVTFGPQTTDRTEGRSPEIPGNPASIPLPAALTLPSPGTANVLTTFLRLGLTGASPEIEIATTPGISYRLETSPDLRTWTPAGAAATTATGSSLILPVPTSSSRQFLRVRVGG